MNEPSHLEHQRLPEPASVPPVARFINPFTHFLQQSTTGGILVLVAALAALVIANSSLWPHFENLLHTSLSLSVGTLHMQSTCWHLINDGLMALFFLVVGLEIKRELLVGELRTPRKAILPVVAAVGGMVVPAFFYALFNHGGPGASGWGVPMATDIAFALGILRLVGRIPPAALVFLAALAIVDDLGAVLVIALFYTKTLNPMALMIAAGIVVGLVALGRQGVRHPLPFIVLGLALWMAVLASGVHATVAGVLLAFCIPAQGTVEPDRTLAWTARFSEAQLKTQNTGNTIEILADGIARGRSPMIAWEHALAPWASIIIVPIFALANAGVVLNAKSIIHASGEPIFWGVIMGLVLGKPLGVVGASLLAVRWGWASLPEGVDHRGVIALGLLAGVGFTMALFIADLAFGPDQRLDTAKAAILAASFIAGGSGFWLCHRWLRSAA